MPALRFDQARALILEKLQNISRRPATETLALDQSLGRVLAESVQADRDYPPFNRSARDGFAVRCEDVAKLPARLKLIGETRAGEPSRYSLGAGETVEIMTGAPCPQNADGVVMVEHSRREGDSILLEQGVPANRNIVFRGEESAQGDPLLEPGLRLDYPQIALLASVGRAAVSVYARPTAAILSTGDEVLPIDASPEPYQIRNSNAHSLAAQVRRRGGEPRILPIAADRPEDTRKLIRLGLESDVLLLSGGVSMGKYDLVEPLLDEIGAEIFITSVKIQPGKPLVFGMAGEVPIFGLPGNPISTMVTFEVFARAAVELLGGRADCELPFVEARLGSDFRHKPVLTRFLPARLAGEHGEARVDPVKWQGSGDLAAIARSNCYLVAAEEREFWQAGERISVLPH
jgi:molybdopterin molybdotransferase